MKLLEHEGKSILARHGVKIPGGALWPKHTTSPGGWMVKAQVLGGGRGLGGGVIAVQTVEEMRRVATELLDRDIDGRTVHSVYIEERISAESEIYVATSIDRDNGLLLVIVGRTGGVDIESADRSDIREFYVDPLIGIADYQLREIERFLRLPAVYQSEVRELVGSLVNILVVEEAELVEVNPAILGTDGHVYAADARVALDDDAMFRHAQRAHPVAWSSDGAFMARCRELGVIGIDDRKSADIRDRTPTVAVLGNGAGLTMATYDQLALTGLRVIGGVELHGALARGEEHLADVFGAFFMLRADLWFVNAFYQLRSCEVIAAALGAALVIPGAPAKERVFARMRGVDDLRSRAIAADSGYYCSASLREAVSEIVQSASMLKHS